MVMPYHLHMPSYFLETFTEYPYVYPQFIHHSQIFALEQLFQVFHSVVSCIRMG